MKRGEIYDVDIPPYPGEPGTEQHGGRPAIIMAVDSIRTHLSNVLVVPLTSQLARLSAPGSVLISPTPGNGLLMDSVALTSQLRAIDKKRFLTRRGEISSKDLAQIEQELRRILGL